jgi:hypothetical protein
MVPGRRAELLLRERVALFLARPAPDLPLDRFAGLLAELLAVRLLELLERPAVEPDASTSNASADRACWLDAR